MMKFKTALKLSTLIFGLLTIIFLICISIISSYDDVEYLLWFTNHNFPFINKLFINIFLGILAFIFFILYAIYCHERDSLP